MGNQLASCGCGEREPPPAEEYRPLDKPPETEDRKKEKWKGKLLSPKRRKKKNRKKKDAEQENQPTEESEGGSKDVEEFIRVDINRPAEWRTLKPSSAPRLSEFTRRPLFPESPSNAPSGGKSARKTSTKERTPVVKFVDDDIDVAQTDEPDVSIHTSTESLPSELRDKLEDKSRISTNEKDSFQRFYPSEPLLSQVDYQLAKKRDWLKLDQTIREQYDIVYVTDGEVHAAKGPFEIQQIVVYVQKETQRILVLISSLRQPAMRKSCAPLCPLNSACE